MNLLEFVWQVAEVTTALAITIAEEAANALAIAPVEVAHTIAPAEEAANARSIEPVEQAVTEVAIMPA